MATAGSLLARPVDEAVRLVAIGFLDAANAALGRLDDPEDAEALHDFRVALRRLRSTLRAYRAQVGAGLPRKVRRELKALQQATNVGRDTEVALAWLRPQRQHLKPSERHGHTWIVDRLEERRVRAYRSATEEVSRGFAHVERRLRGQLSRYRKEVRLDAPLDGERLGAVAANLTRDHAVELGDRLARISAAEDQEAVHAARIAAKRLRYLLEPFAAEVAEVGPLLKRLKALQDVMGELHDSLVLERELAEGLEAAAAQRARWLLDQAIRGDEQDGKTRRRVRAVERSGLLALARLSAARREALFAQLAANWLENRAEPFLAEVTHVAAHLAALSTPGLEVERKYLLGAVPPRASEAPSVEVEQGWLPGARLQERVRRIRGTEGTRYYRTVKDGVGVARIELEEEAPASVFAALWPLTEGRRVCKRRYTVADGDLGWEIDQFLDRDLVLAEVELPTPDTEVSLPDWLLPYVVREVTGEPEFLNLNLAR